MLGGNSPVTVWNRDGGGAFRRTLLETPCRVRHRTERAQSGHGAGRSVSVFSTLVFVIPLLENYLPPAEWEALEDKAGFFTVRPDDYIAAGLHGLEIGPGGLKADEARRKLEGQFMAVQAVAYRLYAHLGKHIRAEGT